MMVWKKRYIFFFFVFLHPGGSVSLTGVRESGSNFGRLPDDPGGFTCMQLQVGSVTDLPFDVNGISPYKSKLIVTTIRPHPTSVKMIDQTGKVYWSVSTYQTGGPLFSFHISCHDDGTLPVVFTDVFMDVLTTLNGETGKIIMSRELRGKEPKGLAIDAAGNIFVCCLATGEVMMFQHDLSGESVLLSSREGLGRAPGAIAYDDVNHQLLVAYTYRHTRQNCVDIYQI